MDNTFLGPYAVTNIDAETEEEERAVLEKALTLCPTLKGVATRFRHNWKLNEKEVWEMARPGPPHKGTEGGGVWGGYL